MFSDRATESLRAEVFPFTALAREQKRVLFGPPADALDGWMTDQEKLQQVIQAAAYVCDKFAMYDLEHNAEHRLELRRDVDRLRKTCWPELFDD